MRCFIHVREEAISVCKQCGKAMCSNCSAYSQHSGICPECRRNEFIQERSALKNRLRSNIARIILSVCVAIISIALSVYLMVTTNVVYGVIMIAFVICAVRLIFLVRRRKSMMDRLNFITKEINKLTLSLKQGIAVI